MRIREVALKLLLVFVSLFAALAASEIVSRFIYPKSDIFPAAPAKDPILGHKILPHQTGHDAKGFRNDSEVGSFPVVCVGDSMIYGNGVSRWNAIPQQLARMLKIPVYNMGMGGYGPVQYFHMIDDAKKMGAKKLVIAFYLGNDITDAYAMSETREHWNYLLAACNQEDLPSFENCPAAYQSRDPTWSDPDLLTIQLKTGDSLIWKIHSFLRLNSVFYAMSYEYALKPATQALFEKGKLKSLPGIFYSDSTGIVFRPAVNLTALDLKNDKVKCGLKITTRIIKLIGEKYQNRRDFLFVIIPTKESVYYNYFKERKVAVPSEYECEVHYERIISARLSEILSSCGFQYVDTYPELEKAAARGVLLYHKSSDDHPNATGYELISTQIYEAIKDSVK